MIAPNVRPQGSLYQQVKLARFWLPVTIVGLVVLHQLAIVPLGNERWQFWAQLLFYSILGPAATFATLNWIASEVRARERAQGELEHLYRELQESNALLKAIQKVTERFAGATDLETALSAASFGIAEVTGACGTAVLLGSTGPHLTKTHGLTPGMREDAVARNRALSRGEMFGEPCAHGEPCWVLSAPLVWGGRFEGGIHAYFDRPPTPGQRESFSILSAEFSAAAEATRSRTRDLLTLFEVDRSIRAEGNLERLLETLLTQTMLRTEATSGGVYLADEEHLQLRAWHGLAQPPAQTAVRYGEGFIGRAAASVSACTEGSLSEEEKRSGGPLLVSAESAVSLPLSVDEALLGVVILAHENPHHFDEANLPFLSLLASQVSLAVRNATAYLQSEELAIAEERARIAREIHDGVAQCLAFAALKLDLVERLMKAQPEEAVRELQETKGTVRETIKEVRRSIFALRPIDLERHGFVETLRRYSSDYGQQNDIRVVLEVQETPELTLKSEAALFRIFQEAMNNVAKHAEAKEVRVKVGKTSAQVFIQIEDDGCGFDPQQVSDRVTSAGGLGLKQMRERMMARGGRFEIASRPKGGTRLYASLPA